MREVSERVDYLHTEQDLFWPIGGQETLILLFARRVNQPRVKQCEEVINEKK